MQGRKQWTLGTFADPLVEPDVKRETDAWANGKVERDELWRDGISADLFALDELNHETREQIADALHRQFTDDDRLWYAGYDLNVAGSAYANGWLDALAILHANDQSIEVDEWPSAITSPNSDTQAGDVD